MTSKILLKLRLSAKALAKCACFCFLWLSMMNVAMATLFGSDLEWTEQARQSNGEDVEIHREQVFGGLHELGQPPPIKEEKLSFSIQGTKGKLTWITEYGKEIGFAKLWPIAVHLDPPIAYVISTPSHCNSYNLYGRPNPPYVIHRSQESGWEQIGLNELPEKFHGLNLTIDTIGLRKKIKEKSHLSAEQVRSFNKGLQRKEFIAIQREPIEYGSSLVGCPDPGKYLFKPSFK